MSEVGKLKVCGLRRRIGDFVLEADFEVGSGERLGLVGRSGSGKTTLLRLIAGLDSPDAGEIALGGEDISGRQPENRGIGVVFQEAALFPALDVVDNVTYGLMVRGAGRKEREAEARTWLARVGMEDKARSRVHRLSGGERQRIAFLRAMLWKPRLLLLDEPFSALDDRMRERVRAELIELHRLWPAPMIVVTHDEADMGALATGRLLLKEEDGGAVRKVIRA